MNEAISWYRDIDMSHVEVVGGKNASLGEMIQNLSRAGISVPDGFATTAEAFREFLAANDLDERIRQRLEGLDVGDVAELSKAGAEIRSWVTSAKLQPELEEGIRDACTKILSESDAGISFAVRSSATAEDLPEASFAGQQDSFLNVAEVDDVVARVLDVFASLYNDRAISYRVHHGFDHNEVSISAGVQRMVRSDLGASGVMFSIDTETGFEDVVLITSSWGLGEGVVQGIVNPDEFYVYKPGLAEDRSSILRKHRGEKAHKMIYGTENSVKTVEVDDQGRQAFSLTDEDIVELAKMAVTIEKHFGRPMDIEWGKDGADEGLYILQARPETVKSRDSKNVIQRYRIDPGERAPIVEGRSIGQRIGSGTVRVVDDISGIGVIEEGDVLVTDMTDPDWEPVMQKSSALVTNRGGRTCHAAIIARELGVPAVVGCGDATTKLKGIESATVSCAEGDVGKIYEGLIDFKVEETTLETLPELPFKVMLNVGSPERAFDFRTLPNHGIGLARLEFIINNTIGIHPKAILGYRLMEEDVRRHIESVSAGYGNPEEFYVAKLAEGISTLCAAFSGKPVIVRLSDFKSNEYANMFGGQLFEPEEENPMIGFRGASRYISSSFRECFRLECEAVKRVRDDMGLTNLEVMIPFVRTLDEADEVIELLAENGLERGKNGLRVIMMCEIPSNALLAEDFLDRFDGFSIGSNDLTQLTLGLDRDSGLIAHLFDERDPAVMSLLAMAIRAAKKKGKYVGICGQGPSDHPDLAKWLMDEGIDSVSLNPDTVVETWMYLAE
ncbi:MAG: phosphoenolpyruvate synthase [Acidobacteria bacterium]|nr:MAG: phosphoenolpyruvate synthase [Acidobacteriota bacterium]REJ99369.1 MAG: phosphoenolpyruvate synthase [Acidobacteriota bacterium]REK16461.1 MAG: phosphoenolpyruvate synthase [Acidobacteriota bacterium]REK44143.1 MAG: phosphoenolpyruvate synthase [Acidobacteriota bacterium]